MTWFLKGNQARFYELDIQQGILYISGFASEQRF